VTYSIYLNNNKLQPPFLTRDEERNGAFHFLYAATAEAV
jgi:hypothetical protein